MDIKTIIEIITILVTLTGQFVYLKVTQSKQGEELKSLQNDMKTIYSHEKEILKLQTQLDSHQELSKNSISTLELSFKELEKWVEAKFDSLEKRISSNHDQLLGKFEELLKEKR